MQYMQYMQYADLSVPSCQWNGFSMFFRIRKKVPALAGRDAKNGLFLFQGKSDIYMQIIKEKEQTI